MRRMPWLGVGILACFLFVGASSAQALTLLEKLGGLIYRDTNLSLNFNQSCMTCHHPSAGFEDPVNRRDPVNFPVSQGSDPGMYGGRNAPSAAYAGFSPVLAQVDGVWTGGMFWDGRATGWEPTLKDPLAQQAQGPFQNPVEMGLSPDEVVRRVAASSYAHLFTRLNLPINYDNIARAIAAYERSTAVTRFTSRFDQFWAACNDSDKQIKVSAITSVTPDLPTGILTTRQLQGLALFNAKCSACHSTEDAVDGKVPPLFTDYTYDNLGIPTHWRVYELAGGQPPDLGLGGFLESEGKDGYNNEYGKFKVPTLRNVAKSPPYGHNGYFPTLLQIVHYYNTRDVKDAGWPAPEYPDTMNKVELGDLGLTADEEWSLVVFMQSLNDEGQ